jgi:hypothetical protein
MARYVIKDEVSTGIKESLKKWGEIPIRTEYLDGVVKIKNYRKYTWAEEVDVVFQGKIFVRIMRESKRWHTSSILKTHNISKVKLNRFLRKCSLNDIQTRMNYFGVDLKQYYNISKIKWE